MDQVDDDLAEPRLIAPDRWNTLRDIDHETETLALGEDPEPLGRVARNTSQINVVEQDERTATLDPGEIEQLVDHLDEVTGLDFDLADPVAHAGRDAVAGGLGLAGEGLRQEADRRERGSQLVRQVVDELGPDLLEAAELGHVFEDDPHSTHRRAPRPDDQDWAIGTAQPILPRRRSTVAGRGDHLPDSRIDKCFQDGPTAERAGCSAEQEVGSRIGEIHRAVLSQTNDPDAHQVGQVRGVADLLIELGFGAIEPVAEAPDEPRDVGPVVELQLPPGGSRPVCVPGDGRPCRVEGPLPVEGDPDRDGKGDREGAHERDEDPVHRTRGSHSSLSGGVGSRRCTPQPNEAPNLRGTPGDRAVQPAFEHPGGTLRLRLIPRDERFFDLFVEDVANVLGGARLLEAMLRTYDQPESRAAEIRVIEHRGDEISHDIGQRLEATFVTPFDREDIHALISGLDDILDLIEEVADTFVLYRVDAPTGTAVEQAAIIVRQVEQLHEALTCLQGFKGLERYWIEVHRLENEGDRIVRAAIAALFNDEKDPITLVKWKDIYGLLEATIDMAEDVANVIERIVIKHS